MSGDGKPQDEGEERIATQQTQQAPCEDCSRSEGYRRAVSMKIKWMEYLMSFNVLRNYSDSGGRFGEYISDKHIETN